MHRLLGAVGFLLLSAATVQAQQNLFNIPNGDITPKGRIFYQQQINTYTQRLETKGHFVYGLGRGWDAGVNVVGLSARFRPNWQFETNDRRIDGALKPVVMATLQKQFDLGEQWKLNVGTQMGTNLTGATERKAFNQFTYGLVGYHPAPGRRILAGPYVTNAAYVGPGNHAGMLVGYEWRLTEKWYLMGDWISGRHSQAVGVFGFMYWPFKHVQFCAGLLVPNTRNPGPNGLVFEINILGWDAKH